MRRIMLWVLTTVSVVAGLFSYHTSTAGPRVITPGTVFSSTQQTPAGGQAGSTATGTGAGSGAGSGGSAGSAGAATSVTGPVVQTRYGPVQVRLDLAGADITKVSVLQYPNANGTDQQISSYSLPILVRETMTAQSARVDMVSGATYTSTGYLQSLQAALDQAKA